LDKAEELKLKSIAMPAIRSDESAMIGVFALTGRVLSSGIFGFPKDLCAKVMFETTFAYMQEKAASPTAVTDIHFTNFDEQTTKLFEEARAFLVTLSRPSLTLVSQEAARWKARLEGSAPVGAASPLRAAGAAAAPGSDTGFRASYCSLRLAAV
jgi:hypothetical protein